jgi:CRISPR-associated exonuclease Cas4
MNDVEERLFVTVTDLKQYIYCPRIVYYTYCLPLIRPTTYKMEAGIKAHEKASKRERRRTLTAYGLDEGKRRFDVWLRSPILGLTGKVDMVIEVTEGKEQELIPVEYKQTRRKIGKHIRLQLAAYGMMLEERWNLGVKRGFVYSLLRRKAESVSLTKQLCTEAKTLLAEMREMIRREAMPDPPRSPRQCVNCEFRRFCNDVL